LGEGGRKGRERDAGRSDLTCQSKSLVQARKKKNHVPPEEGGEKRKTKEKRGVFSNWLCRARTPCHHDKDQTRKNVGGEKDKKWPSPLPSASQGERIGEVMTDQKRNGRREGIGRWGWDLKKKKFQDWEKFSRKKTWGSRILKDRCATQMVLGYAWSDEWDQASNGNGIRDGRGIRKRSRKAMVPETREGKRERSERMKNEGNAQMIYSDVLYAATTGAHTGSGAGIWNVEKKNATKPSRMQSREGGDQGLGFKK